MSFDVEELHCTVSHEILAATGESLKRTVHKSSILSLARNELREIFLKLSIGKTRDMKFKIKEVSIHQKFAKDGKATIKLINQNVQFMLSNCPPDQLRIFLKALSTKLVCQQQKPPVSDRQRLLSEKPRVLQEISPLVLQELQTVHSLRAKEVENRTDLFTPKGKTKRKWNGDAIKENRKPKLLKSGLGLGAIQSKMSTVLKPLIAPVILTKEQTRVLDVVKSGRSVFFTGSAGTGKSFLLKRIIGSLPPQHTFATASTGVAACHIGGTTLHSFAGIGSGKADLKQCIELASRAKIAQQWRMCRHLIIDEISMVDGDVFNKLEAVARVIRKTETPFGGIQLIVCGDFLQLPPVTKQGQKRKFAFQSKAWRSCISVNMELTDVKRQTDQKFISILQNIRLGRCPPQVEATLKGTSKNVVSKNNIQATRLCTHKQDVEQLNDYHLEKLSGTAREFNAVDSDPDLASLMNSHCPVPAKLQLKVGAQVMLTKNLDVQKGLVNGARGVVTGYEAGSYGKPLVQFLCGEECTIQSDRWTFKVSGGMMLSRRQLPLKLAWAISVHKSQGMSLDCVEMSLARVFESGQAYVALSRARSLQGLRIIDFNKNCVHADPDVLSFYQNIQHEKTGQTQSTLDMYDN